MVAPADIFIKILLNVQKEFSTGVKTGIFPLTFRCGQALLWGHFLTHLAFQEKLLI